MEPDAYHAASRSGRVMSSGMLREFRRCPAHYRAITTGRMTRPDTGAFRFGRAVHKLVLEGEAAFRACFTIGGPLNDRTGRSYGADSRMYAEWLRANSLERGAALTCTEADAARRIRDAALGHPEIAALLAEGWPERSARARLEEVDCQIRLDWLGASGRVVDLKTVDNIAWFESDARRYGYLHQFAFYREVAREAGGGDVEICAAVVEKKPPYRAGVWEFPGEVLDPYAGQNRRALNEYARCLRENRWPTGYEKRRRFSPAGISPLWFN